MQIRQDDRHITAEFPDDLAADAARRRQVFSVHHYRDAAETFFAARDTFPDRNAFGTTVSP